MARLLFGVLARGREQAPLGFCFYSPPLAAYAAGLAVIPPFGGGVGWLLLTLVLGFGGLASRQAVREGFGLRTGSASSERKLTPLSPTLNRF